MKTPPAPEGPGFPFAAPSILSLIHPWGGAFHITGWIWGALGGWIGFWMELKMELKAAVAGFLRESFLLISKKIAWTRARKHSRLGFYDWNLALFLEFQISHTIQKYKIVQGAFSYFYVGSKRRQLLRPKERLPSGSLGKLNHWE